MLIALIRKDMRLFVPIAATCLLIILLPYVIVIGFYLCNVPIRSWPQCIADFSIMSLWITVLLTALLAGSSVAVERQDKSAHFIERLPIPPSSFLLSKLIVLFGAIGVLWLIDLTILYSAMGDFSRYTDQLGSIAISSLVAFGFSWFLSTISKNPVTAAIGGILCALLWRGATQFLGNIPNDIPYLMKAVCDLSGPLLALFTFAAGVWIMTCARFLEIWSPKKSKPLRNSTSIISFGTPGSHKARLVALVWKDVLRLKYLLIVTLCLQLLPHIVLIARPALREVYILRPLYFSMVAGLICLAGTSATAVAGEFSSNTFPFLNRLPSSRYLPLISAGTIAAIPMVISTICYMYLLSMEEDVIFYSIGSLLLSLHILVLGVSLIFSTALKRTTVTTIFTGLVGGIAFILAWVGAETFYPEDKNGFMGSVVAYDHFYTMYGRTIFSINTCFGLVFIMIALFVYKYCRQQR